MFTKKIKLYSRYPVITDLYPIYSAKEYKRKWVKNCAEAFQKYKKKIDNRSNVMTAARCPGIRGVMEKGYIVTTWCDITIETTDEDYKVYYPQTLDKFLKDIDYTDSIVTDFNMKESPMRIPTGDSLPRILKFWVPWCMNIPKGYELMFMPIQYDDDSPFTACTGVLPEGDNVEFNVHVYWHRKNERVFIPAGTPLCQLVPIKKEACGLSFHSITDKINRRMLKRLLQYTNKYVYNRR